MSEIANPKRVLAWLETRSLRARLLAVILVTVSPLAAQETQDLGAPDECFEGCHAGAMEMLENGYPLWAAKVGFSGCMQITCGADMG
jgi:hypothetical protein